jgi:hypothetical protein
LGKVLLAFITLLALWGIGEYTVTHDRTSNVLSSRRRMLRASLRLNNFFPHYTTNPLCKPVYTLSYPLAIRTCRKETRCPR